MGMGRGNARKSSRKGWPSRWKETSDESFKKDDSGLRAADNITITHV